MLIEEFTNLPINQKIDYAKDFGTFLIGRAGKIYVYNLYEVHDFFVEIEWDIRTSKQIGVYAFNDISRLDKYLERIYINDLKENLS